jgi:hypothetical protein
VKGVFELLNFNRGLISRLGMARVDLKRTALSAETQTNWMPRVLGSMSLRPGLKYIASESGATKVLPFVFSSTDTALVRLHDEDVSFVVADVPLTRPAVTAAVTNGSFTTNLSGWTNLGIAPAWETGGGVRLTGDGTAVSDLLQNVTLNESGTEHGLRVVVARGTVVVRIATAALGTEYVRVELGVGTHSIGFTPNVGATFTIALQNQSTMPAIVSSVAIEAAGVVTLPTPWGEDVLPLVRSAQSGDILFLAAYGYQQRKIARQNSRSWSVELYQPVDGPFRVENTTPTTIAASAITGDITLTASGSASNGIFRPTHVGALFSLSSVGQAVTSSFTAQNQFGNSIRVTGSGAARSFSIVITGTFTADVTLQYSTDDATWVDRTTYTAETSTSLTDGLDNQIIYYRLGVKTGDYTSGTAVSSLSFSLGSITGVARITGYTSPTVVSATVLSDLGGTAATEVWAEGAWSDYRGWPSSVAFHDGRLFWAGKDKFWGSVTDQFYTFDAEFEGDAGPISRSIGYGPVDAVNWLISLNRLIAGTDGAVVECKSSSFDEPLTPTNFTPKTPATRGCERIDAVKIDNTAVFVQRSGFRVFEIDNGIGPNGSILSSLSDITTLVPEVCSPGVVALAVQREPDTRLHCVLSDGTVAILIWDRAEEVRCWVKFETDGEVTDVCVIPGTDEDFVYYVVKRTIDGSDVYMLEKWAFESECTGQPISKCADSFVFAAGASNVITGLGHLEGQEVVAWGGGEYLGEFTVASGQITLHASTTYTNRCAGLAYQARFKSTKLAYSMPGRSGLGRAKKISKLGLVLLDAHPESLKFGRSFDALDPMPEIEAYQVVSGVWDEYDAKAIDFPGEWAVDSRLCMTADAPKPCTVLAAIVELETN